MYQLMQLCGCLVVVVLLLGCGGVGIYLGWFKLSDKSGPGPVINKNKEGDDIDLTGDWAGTLTQDGVAGSSPLELNLSQTGKTVTGTTSIKIVQGSKITELKRSALNGTFDGRSLLFEETNFMVKNGPWLLIKSELKLSTVNKSIGFSGSWGSLPDGKFSGQINLRKK